MSHKATNWLSSLPAEALSPSEFRVLFHLCDCHNASDGCFPKQAYLMAQTGVSNGTLNNALKAMELRGLIKRHQGIDPKTKRQRPTRYILGFEIGQLQDPTPENGDGKPRKPTPENGDGADSKKRAKPSPAGWSLRTSKGTKGARACTREGGADDVALMWAESIREGRHIPVSAVSPKLARRMIALGLVDQATLVRLGIAC